MRESAAGRPASFNATYALTEALTSEGPLT